MHNNHTFKMQQGCSAVTHNLICPSSAIGHIYFYMCRNISRLNYNITPKKFLKLAFNYLNLKL